MGKYGITQVLPNKQQKEDHFGCKHATVYYLYFPSLFFVKNIKLDQPYKCFSFSDAIYIHVSSFISPPTLNSDKASCFFLAFPNQKLSKYEDESNFVTRETNTCFENINTKNLLLS